MFLSSLLRLHLDTAILSVYMWRKRNFATPKICFWQMDHSELVIFKELLTKEQLWIPNRRDPKVRDTYINKGCLPCSTKKQTDSKSLEIVVNTESKDVNLPNSKSLVYCVSWSLPMTGSLFSTSSFLFSQRWCFNWWLGPFCGVPKFSWPLPSTQEAYLLSNFHFFLFICYTSIIGPAETLRREERKIFLSLYRFSFLEAFPERNAWKLDISLKVLTSHQVPEAETPSKEYWTTIFQFSVHTQFQKKTIPSHIRC